MKTFLRSANDAFSNEREEQDATLSSFAESEQRAPQTLWSIVIYGLWKLRPNTTGSFIMWIGRTLNSNLEQANVAPGTTAGTIEPWLKRLQFDLIDSF